MLESLVVERITVRHWEIFRTTVVSGIKTLTLKSNKTFTPQFQDDIPNCLRKNGMSNILLLRE